MDALIKAIFLINPKAEFVIREENIIEWMGDTPPIAQGEIDARIGEAELEISLEKLRFKRNSLLAESDFHALSDVEMSAETKQYRQDLRDLPAGLETIEDVDSVVWPELPA